MNQQIEKFPLHVAKNLALFRQGLLKKSQSKPSKKNILEQIEKIGIVQIDCASIVDRSHYLVIFSRLGCYNKKDLDELYWPDGMLTEQWVHAASIVPTSHLPYLWPVISSRRHEPIPSRKLKRLGNNPLAFLKRVEKHVYQHGPAPTSEIQFRTPTGNRKWWNRRPEREALEILFRCGKVFVQRRVNFERHYDIPERVIVHKLINSEYDSEKSLEWFVLSGLSFQGIATARQIADYYRQPLPIVLNVLERLACNKTVLPVVVEGWKESAYIHSKDLVVLSKGNISQENSPNLTTFLSPFDNLIWNRGRTRELFQYEYKNEMYVSSKSRVRGYYAMPILHCGKLIGHIDPKVDRAVGHMCIRNIAIDDANVAHNVVPQIATALLELMKFCSCTCISIEHSKPLYIKRSVLKEISKCQTS